MKTLDYGPHTPWLLIRSMSSRLNPFISAALTALALKIFVVSPSQALAEPLETMRCSELAEEMNKFLGTEGLGNPSIRHQNNPLWTILDKFTEGLDRLSYYRIVSVLAADLPQGCIYPSEEMQAWLIERGLSEDPTVLQHIDFMLSSFDMKRSLPKWGLIELPELDFSTWSFGDWLEDQSNLADDVFANPFNDTLFAEYSIYLEGFDLSSAESREAAGQVFREVLNGQTIDLDVPLSLILDDLTEKYGLKRK